MADAASTTEVVSLVSSLIGSLGFPIVVAIYLLIRSSKEHKSIDTTLSAVNATMASLKEAIVALSSKIGKD